VLRSPVELTLETGHYRLLEYMEPGALAERSGRKNLTNIGIGHRL